MRRTITRMQLNKGDRVTVVCGDHQFTDTWNGNSMRPMGGADAVARAHARITALWAAIEPLTLPLV